jgi:hypothetical protein
MPHAVVVQVKLDPVTDAGHRHSILNEFVIPEAKALPGFRRGTWMNDGAGTGTCIVVFDTEEQARSAVGPLTPIVGPPVITSAVCAVEMEA